MNDDQNQIDDDDSSERSKRGKKGGSSSGAPADRIVITPELSASMARFGVTMDQLKQIIKNWSYIPKDSWAKVIGGLAKDIARASAHVAVDFVGNFSIVTDFLISLRSTPITPTHKIGHDEKKSPRGPR